MSKAFQQWEQKRLLQLHKKRVAAARAGKGRKPISNIKKKPTPVSNTANTTNNSDTNSVSLKSKGNAQPTVRRGKGKGKGRRGKGKAKLESTPKWLLEKRWDQGIGIMFRPSSPVSQELDARLAAKASEFHDLASIGEKIRQDHRLNETFKENIAELSLLLGEKIDQISTKVASSPLGKTAEKRFFASEDGDSSAGQQLDFTDAVDSNNRSEDNVNEEEGEESQRYDSDDFESSGEEEEEEESDGDGDDDVYGDESFEELEETFHDLAALTHLEESVSQLKLLNDMMSTQGDVPLSPIVKGKVPPPPPSDESYAIDSTASTPTADNDTSGFHFTLNNADKLVSTLRGLAAAFDNGNEDDGGDDGGEKEQYPFRPGSVPKSAGSTQR